MSRSGEKNSAQSETFLQHSILAQTKSTLMFRQNIANSKKLCAVKVSLIELKFVSLIPDIPHYDLLKCQINQRHFYNVVFLELQIQTALCTVLLK